MSKLEMSGEPTMDEILASIRKMVAEEPIGARQTPAGLAISKSQESKTPAPGVGSGARGPQRPFLSDALGIDELLDGGDPARKRDDAAVGSLDRAGAPTKPIGAALQASPQVPGAHAAKGANAGERPDAPQYAAGSREPAQKVALPKLGPNGSDPPPRPNGAGSGQTVTTAKADSAVARTDANVALSAAQAKIDRHLGAPPAEEPSRTPVPGVKSIRDLGLSGGKQSSDMQAPAKTADDGQAVRAAGATARADQPAAGEAPQPKPKDAATSVAGVGTGPAKVENATAATDGDGGKKAGANAGNADSERKAPAPAKPANDTQSPAAAVHPGGQGQARAKSDAPRSLEDSIAEMLRPMLREWLDSNLPRLVQQALREELAKTSLPGQDKPPA